MIEKLIILGLFFCIILLAIVNRILNTKVGKRLPRTKNFVNKTNSFIGWFILFLFILSIFYVFFYITPKIQNGTASRLLKNTR